MGMKKEEAVKSANKLPESPEGEFRAIDDISLYCLQYAMSCLWDSVPPEKTSERSKRLFKELCDSLEYDFGADPNDNVRREVLIRFNYHREDAAKDDKNEENKK